MNRKEIKGAARLALKNDRWSSVGVLLVGQLLAGIAPLFLNGAMTYGINEYYMKSLNGEAKSFNDLFAGFKKYGKVLGTDILMTIYLFFWAFIPVVGIVKMFSYSQTFLVLRDNPELTANQAITKSREIMKGHKAQLFGLTLSFLGWRIVTCFTFGLLDILFVGPYWHYAQMEFYNKIK
jgi:uncharacterized membrane protein